jgi:hypothetical protein
MGHGGIGSKSSTGISRHPPFAAISCARSQVSACSSGRSFVSGRSWRSEDGVVTTVVPTRPAMPLAVIN